MSADGSLPVLTEIDGIKYALDELLRAAVEAKPRRSQPCEPISASVLARYTIERLIDCTEAERKAGDLILNPVGEATRQAIRTLGKRLYELGGLDLMQRVLDDVAEIDPRNEGRRIGIMDHRWDGIGRTDKSAGWCS